MNAHMNAHTHRTIYNQARGCLMAVAETATSSGKASGESRQTKSVLAACLQANHSMGCRQASIQYPSTVRYRAVNTRATRQATAS